MNRRNFLAYTGEIIIVAGVTYYLLSDKNNFTRADIDENGADKVSLTADEREILFLASLAPSGHNTQPWLVKHLGPYHWIIGNDKSKWLSAVDPLQRETILSIGAFLQNLEYAANHLGYQCMFKILAQSAQDENLVEARLYWSGEVPDFEVEKIKKRRVVRSNYLADVLKKEDAGYLTAGETDFIHYIPNISKEHLLVNEQTIEANKIQSYRDPAQQELSDWIRFSSKEAQKKEDGLTIASMEMNGIPAWVLRNFYGKSSVMQKGFRDQNIDNVKKQVAQSAGWFLITSKDNTIATLLETGKRMQRLFLKVREKNIAIHPMTQILEEPSMSQMFSQSIGISEPVQFILRAGYLKNYPEPVSLRRPVERFIRS